MSLAEDEYRWGFEDGAAGRPARAGADSDHYQLGYRVGRGFDTDPVELTPGQAVEAKLVDMADVVAEAKSRARWN